MKTIWPRHASLVLEFPAQVAPGSTWGCSVDGVTKADVNALTTILIKLNDKPATSNGQSGDSGFGGIFRTGSNSGIPLPPRVWCARAPPSAPPLVASMWVAPSPLLLQSPPPCASPASPLITSAPTAHASSIAATAAARRDADGYPIHSGGGARSTARTADQDVGRGGGGIAGQSMPETQITGGDARNSKVKTQLPTCSSTWEMT